MSDEPEVIEQPPAPEISDAEYPVPQEILEWEAENVLGAGCAALEPERHTRTAPFRTPRVGELDVIVELLDPVAGLDHAKRRRRRHTQPTIVPAADWHVTAREQSLPHTAVGLADAPRPVLEVRRRRTRSRVACTLGSCVRVAPRRGEDDLIVAGAFTWAADSTRTGANRMAGKQLTKHFHSREFDCRDGTPTPSPRLRRPHATSARPTSSHCATSTGRSTSTAATGPPNTTRGSAAPRTASTSTRCTTATTRPPTSPARAAPRVTGTRTLNWIRQNKRNGQRRPRPLQHVRARRPPRLPRRLELWTDPYRPTTGGP